MSLQSVSLVSGTGMVWVGAALTVAGLATSLVLARRTWLIVVLVIVCALAIGSAIYDEVQLQHRRDELNSIFDE